MRIAIEIHGMKFILFSLLVVAEAVFRLKMQICKIINSVMTSLKYYLAEALEAQGKIRYSNLQRRK
jgi:hypothetical protein